MEMPAMQEETIMIDDSSEAYAERLELCVLRSASFAAENTGAPMRGFFTACFQLLENRRGGGNAELQAGSGNGSGNAGMEEDPADNENEELCKLEHFWKRELEGLLPLTEGGSAEDLVTAWETTLQLLFEAESARSEERPVNEKEFKDILYSYVYDYAEEFLLRDGVIRKAGGRTPRRFITELLNGKLEEDGLGPSPAGEGAALFFGDRLKARLLEAVEKCRQKDLPVREDVRNASEPYTAEKADSAPKALGAHQKKALSEFFSKLALLALLPVLVFSLTACGGDSEEETQAEQTEAADTYPGVVGYQDEEEGINDRFGVMHATVLDVQKGDKDGLYVYTLRDEQDPENAWCLYSQEVGSIVAKMEGGKKVAVLFSGDIANDPDSVEFIAILDDAPYEIKNVEGTITANMMNSFTIRTKKGAEVTFIKDNCKVDRDALSTSGNTKVLIYYADFGGDKYPVRVYKATESRR